MRCNRGLLVRVLQSAAGFYIGTTTHDGEPMCRISEEYWKKKADADKALIDNSFKRRESIEILYCRNPYGNKCGF